MIKVMNEVKVYEKHGEAVDNIEIGPMIVESHWIDHNLIVLRIDDKEVAVDAEDLLAAVSNARNSNRF